MFNRIHSIVSVVLVSMVLVGCSTEPASQEHSDAILRLRMVKPGDFITTENGNFFVVEKRGTGGAATLFLSKCPGAQFSAIVENFTRGELTAQLAASGTHEHVKASQEWLAKNDKSCY